jgi:hypothetical protein
MGDWLLSSCYLHSAFWINWCILCIILNPTLSFDRHDRYEASKFYHLRKTFLILGIPFLIHEISAGMWQDWQNWLTPVEQKLLILPEYLGSLPIFSGVRVAQPLVFYVVLCRSLFVLLSRKGPDCDYNKHNISVVICSD